MIYTFEDDLGKISDHNNHHIAMKTILIVLVPFYLQGEKNCMKAFILATGEATIEQLDYHAYDKSILVPQGTLGTK